MQRFSFFFAALLGLGPVIVSFAAEPPSITAPRATSGDTKVEPDWAQRLTITVGPEKADIVGTNQRALQAAVDYVARLGGGTVKVLAGTYHLRNAVFLQSKVRLSGEGEKTILLKDPSVTTKLAADSDWFDQEVTLEDATGFELGDGICLRTKREGGGGDIVLKRTLVARTGNRFKLDRALRENYWRVNGATASPCSPSSPAKTFPTLSSRTSHWTAIASTTRISMATTPAASSSKTANASPSAASMRGTTTATASAGRSATTCWWKTA